MRPWPYSPLSVALAFLAGVLVAVAPFAIPALFAPNGSGVAIAAFIVGVFHAVALGVPAYVGLARRIAPTFWAASGVGFLIGAFPVTLLGLLFVPLEASVGGVVTVSNGSLTIAGLFQLAMLAGSAGLMGALGGLAFWGALKLTTRRIDGAERAGIRLVRTLVLGAGCVVVMASAPIAGSLTHDYSCHNPANTGLRSVTPEIVGRLDIQPIDWPRVERVVERVAARHGLDYRRSREGEAATYEAFHLSACSSNGVRIMALQHYANSDAFPPSSGNPGAEISLNIPMIVSVAQPLGGDDWRAPADDLFSGLEAEFGASLTYENERGEPVSRAEAERS